MMTWSPSPRLRRTRVLWAVLLLSALAMGGGGPGCASSDETETSAPTECETVARHMATVSVNDLNEGDRKRMDPVAAAAHVRALRAATGNQVAGQCNDEMNSKTRKCVLAATTRAQISTCLSPVASGGDLK